MKKPTYRIPPDELEAFTREMEAKYGDVLQNNEEYEMELEAQRRRSEMRLVT